MNSAHDAELVFRPLPQMVIEANSPAGTDRGPGSAKETI